MGTRDTSRDNVTVVQREANIFRILAGLTEALLRCREVKHLSHAQLSSEGDILNKPRGVVSCCLSPSTVSLRVASTVCIISQEGLYHVACLRVLYL